MKRCGTPTNPALLDLAARLGTGIPSAVGVIELCSHYVQDYCPRGMILKWGTGAVATTCDWRKDPKALIDAMVASNWIRRTPEGWQFVAYNGQQSAVIRRQVRLSVGKAYVGKVKRRAVYERDGHRCVRCGSERDLTVDHRKPVASGGGAEIENLQTLCRSCNSRKEANHG